MNNINFIVYLESEGWVFTKMILAGNWSGFLKFLFHYLRVFQILFIASIFVLCLGGIKVISCPNSLIHSVSNKNTIKCNFSICTADDHTAAPIILIHKTSSHSTPLQPRILVNTHQFYDRCCVGIRIAQKKPLLVFHLRVLHIFDLRITINFGFHFSLFWHDLFDLRHIRLIA